MHELRRIETFCPDQHAHVDREEDVREKGIADAQMGCDCAAKIPCQQDRTKDGSTRNHVDDDTSQQEDADSRSEVLRISKTTECLQDRWRLHQFNDGVEKQEQHREGADDASSPEPLL